MDIRPDPISAPWIILAVRAIISGVFTSIVWCTIRWPYATCWSCSAKKCIALGSDYPFPLGEDEPGKLIESLALTAAARQRLLRTNALEWLGKTEAEYRA